MPITEITINAVEPFAEGHAFGDVGAVCPHPRRRAWRARSRTRRKTPASPISTRRRATRAGSSNTRTDFFVLRPAEPRRGSGILVYDVTNRGAKRIFNLLDDVPANDPSRSTTRKTARDAGLGFCFGRGHSIVWSGWDPGAPRANNGLGADFPVAVENGRPITGRIRDEFHVGTRGPADGSPRRLPLPRRLDSTSAHARLAVRDRESDPRTDIPRGGMGIRRRPLDPPACRKAASSSRSRSTSCGTRRPSQRCSASALPRCATSSRSCATSADRATRCCGRRRDPPRARLRRVAERPLPAPFPRSRDEPRQPRPPRVRRRLQPCRRRRQGVRQSPLRHARPHRDTA